MSLSQEILICLACGCENIAGADTCEECGHSLIQEEFPGVSSQEHSILAAPLPVLAPHAPECVPHSATVAQAIARLKGRNVGCVLVTGAGGELVGIFTERDVLCRVAGLIRELDEIPVESLMTPRPTALRTSSTVSHALHLMGLHGFRHVPLVDEAERPVGIISFRDIVRFIEESFARGS